MSALAYRLVLPLWAAGIVGCAATDGALLVRDAEESSPVARGASLQYQLTGTVDTSVDAQVFVTDLFDTRAQDVAALHARGRVVIAYVSVGSLEPWRADASSFPAAVVGMHLAGFPEESWLDVRSAGVQAAMDARLDQAQTKGFDGIYASTLGAYAAVSGFPITRDDERRYVLHVAESAHARGLSPGLSGDFELGDALPSAYDWALAVGCIAGGDCSKLDAFKALDKPVFDLETEGTHGSVCDKARELRIATTLKHDRYDAWRDPCS